MKLNVSAPYGPNPMQMEVEAIPFEDTELAIFSINVNNIESPGPIDFTARVTTEVLGTVWCVADVPSGAIVLYGLLTKDLAVEAARMLAICGQSFKPGTRVRFEIDAFSAASKLMADSYFKILAEAQKSGRN